MSKNIFNFYLIEGRPLARIKIDKNQEFCVECGNLSNKFHELGCIKELSPCKNHKYVLDCDCDIRIGEKI